MENIDISKKGKVELDIIEDHLVKLYSAGVNAERKRIMNELRIIIQEKEVRSDHTAIAVLLWTIDRLNRQL